MGDQADVFPGGYYHHTIFSLHVTGYLPLPFDFISPLF